MTLPTFNYRILSGRDPNGLPKELQVDSSGNLNTTAVVGAGGIPTSIGQLPSADSMSVVLASDYVLPLTTQPTTVIPVDIPTQILAIAGTTYSLALTNVTSVEFFARNNQESIQWHFLPGKVGTNNHYTLPRGFSKSFPLTSEKWTGTLYFLSPKENNIELEVIAFAVSP